MRERERERNSYLYAIGPLYIGSLQSSGRLSALSRPYVAFRVKRESTSEEAQKRFVTREGNTALKKTPSSRKVLRVERNLFLYADPVIIPASRRDCELTEMQSEPRGLSL